MLISFLIINKKHRCLSLSRSLCCCFLLILPLALHISLVSYGWQLRRCHAHTGASIVLGRFCSVLLRCLLCLCNCCNNCEQQRGTVGVRRGGGRVEGSKQISKAYYVVRVFAFISVFVHSYSFLCPHSHSHSQMYSHSHSHFYLYLLYSYLCLCLYLCLCNPC